MGSIHQGIPKTLALKLKELYDLKVFVETGTYFGETTSWASTEFDKVYTIEAQKDFFQRNKKELRELRNVSCLFGESPKKLGSLSKKLLRDKTLYWLDAHWSGGQTHGQNSECPLLDELKSLTLNPSSVIMIDDARLFLQPPPKPHNPDHWPQINQVVHELNKLKLNTFVFEDVIIGVPKSKKTISTAFINWLQTQNDDMTKTSQHPPTILHNLKELISTLLLKQRW